MSHQDRVFFGNFLGVLGALVVLAIIFFFIAHSVIDSDGPTEAMMERATENIKPVGEVYITGESEPPEMPVVVASTEPAAAKEPMSGEQVYNQSCMGCHGTGAAGAPKFGDAGSWAPHIAKGMDTLFKHAISGFNAMPPRGTCGSCSDDEIKAAVEYMVDHSK